MGLVRLPFTGCFGENFHNFYKDRKFAGPLRMEGMEKLTRKGRIPHMVISPLIVRQGADICLSGSTFHTETSCEVGALPRPNTHLSLRSIPWRSHRKDSTWFCCILNSHFSQKKEWEGGKCAISQLSYKPQNPRRLLTTLDTSFDFMWRIF